jgi:RNA 3'-terminal phosphate cyclase (ATP)
MSRRNMIEIDGTFGEGGGQILRTSLALSALTGKAFHIARIRGRRPKPGLHRQHLTAVLAAQRVAEAQVRGTELGSSDLTFAPARVAGGEFRFDVQTAGSAMLVLQTILPPLFHAAQPSTITIRGGTHNPMSPPFDFLAETFLPAIARLGFRAEARLIRHGFYPAGGGEVAVEIEPAEIIQQQDFTTPRGPVVLSARVILARLPDRVWEAEKRALESLELQFTAVECRDISDSAGPGNCVEIVVDRGEGDERSRSVLTAFGERGRPSAHVVEEAAGYARELLAGGAAVDRFLADQLLIFFAMAGGGSLSAPSLTLHATTNLAVIEQFLPVEFVAERVGHVVRLQCRPHQ